MSWFNQPDLATIFVSPKLFSCPSCCLFVTMMLSSWTSPKKLGFQLLLCRLECAEKGTGEKVVLLKSSNASDIVMAWLIFGNLFGHIRSNDELPYILRYRKVAKRIPNLRMCKGKTDVSFIVAWRHPYHSTRIWVCLKWSTPKPSDLSSCSPWISTCWVYFIFRHHFLVWRSDRQSSTSGLLSPRKQGPLSGTWYVENGPENVPAGNQTWPGKSPRDSAMFFHVFSHWNAHLVVFWNHPKSAILIGFSSINNPFWGAFILGNPHLVPEFPSHVWWQEGNWVVPRQLGQTLKR